MLYLLRFFNSPPHRQIFKTPSAKMLRFCTKPPPPLGANRANRTFTQKKASTKIFNRTEATRSHSKFYKLSKKLGRGKGTINPNFPRDSSNIFYYFFNKHETDRIFDKTGVVIPQRYSFKYKITR